MQSNLTTSIRGGLILPPTHIELIVADQCNISCAACNHASPVVGKWMATPEGVRRDFSMLARVMRAKTVKVLGGEPLLHKQLAEVIGAARETGISEHFMLTTNGVLLHRMDDAVMDAIDTLEVSVYPGVQGMQEILALARAKTRAFGKKLVISEYDEFRATYSSVGTQDSALVRKVFDACKIANLWGCHAVRDGVIYRCPQSIYTAQVATEADGLDAEGMPLADDEGFRGRLFGFLTSSTPLKSCRYCVGSVGKKEPHRLVPRKLWRQDTARPLEDLIDYDWLERSLLEHDVSDDCKIQEGRPWRNTLWKRVVAKARRVMGQKTAFSREERRPVRETADEARRRLDKR